MKTLFLTIVPLLLNVCFSDYCIAQNSTDQLLRMLRVEPLKQPDKGAKLRWLSNISAAKIRCVTLQVVDKSVSVEILDFSTLENEGRLEYAKSHKEKEFAHNLLILGLEQGEDFWRPFNEEEQILTNSGSDGIKWWFEFVDAKSTRRTLALLNWEILLGRHYVDKSVRDVYYHVQVVESINQLLIEAGLKGWREGVSLSEYKK